MLKNAVALVTGGGNGLGKGTVEMFIKNGAKVILCDLPESNGSKVAETLGNNVTFVPTNITSTRDIKNAVDITQEKYGRLDIAVNCAKNISKTKIFDSVKNKIVSLDEFHQTLNVNTIGTFNVIRLAAELMSKNEPNENKQRGLIINTAHACAFDGHAGDALVAASNAAIVGMTLPIAREFNCLGIRIMTVAPALMELEYYQNQDKDVTEFLKSLMASPNRLGKISEFAHIIQTIVENPMLNAETIQLDGGFRYI